MAARTAAGSFLTSGKTTVPNGPILPLTRGANWTRPYGTEAANLKDPVMIAHVESSRSALPFLPPAPAAETAWDILVALGAGEGCALTLDELGSRLGASELELLEWLAMLERRRLIAGVRHGPAPELRATLTLAGCALLDRHLT